MTLDCNRCKAPVDTDADRNCVIRHPYFKLPVGRWEVVCAVCRAKEVFGPAPHLRLVSSR